MNVIALTGRLTADPELKTTTSGKAVTSFCIAVDRDKEHSDFINIVAWEKTAEFITKYFTKGRKIEIMGSLQSRKYEDKNGNSRVAYEVLCQRAGFAESKREEKKDEPAAAKTIESDEDLPFRQTVI